MIETILTFELPAEVAQNIAFGLSGIISGTLFGYWLATRQANRKAREIERWTRRFLDRQ